jgi:hypothetical protein
VNFFKRAICRLVLFLYVNVTDLFWHAVNSGVIVTSQQSWLILCTLIPQPSPLPPSPTHPLCISHLVCRFESEVDAIHEYQQIARWTADVVDKLHVCAEELEQLSARHINLHRYFQQLHRPGNQGPMLCVWFVASLVFGL